MSVASRQHRDDPPAGRAPGYREVLTDPVAGRLWLAAAISTVGDYVGVGALLLLAFERSGGRVLGSAAIFAVQALPAMASGALAGTWLDAVDRRLSMAALQLVGAGALILAVLGDGLVPVLVAAGLLGAVRAAFGAVRSGAIAEAVAEERRGGLLALVGSSEQAGQVAGFLTGSTIAVTVGATPALLGDAATFVVAAAVVTTVPLPRPERRPRRRSLTGGLREIWRSPTLRLLAPLAATTGLVSAAPESLATGVVGDGPWLPVVMAAGPAGQAATMWLIGRRREIERVDVQLTHLAALALAFGVGALGGGPGWFVAANLAVGAGTAWLLGPQTLFVQLADPARMAQVTGTMLALLIAAEGLGTVLLGVIADAAGVGRAYWAAGVLILLAAVTAWLVRRRAGITRRVRG